MERMASGKMTMAIAASMLAVACGGKIVDGAGNTTANSTTNDPTTDGDGGSAAATIACGPTGTWSGSIDGDALPSGSHGVNVQLAIASDGSANGTMRFGDGPALSPPTNPDVTYPPGFGGWSTAPSAPPMPFEGEGFTYSLRGGTFANGRLTFRIASRELWKSWCEIQSKLYEQGGPGFVTCLPNWGYSWGPNACSQTDPATGRPVPTDCGKVYLCQAALVCECTETSCTIAIDARLDISFDLVISGGHADGSTSGALGDHGVHLTCGG